MSKSGVDHVATFVAAESFTLTPAALTAALMRAGVAGGPLQWLEPGVAADAAIACAPGDARDIQAQFKRALGSAPVDIIVQPIAARRKALLVADMDSTMIEQECIDELADLLGIRDRIAPITARAMRGEIDFEAALRERVALLRGLTTDAIDHVLTTRVSFSKGAATLVATMRAAGAHTALVSGGFTLFADRIARALGFDEFRANRLIVDAGVITGALEEPVSGAMDKARALEAMRVSTGAAHDATLAIGDGANDLPMIEAASLGVAWRARPRVAALADARLDHADLTALLYAQGFRRSDFIAATPAFR